MRLLKYGENGDLSITEFEEDTKPPYVILPHRWGAEADEITFEDVVGNRGKNKPGYAKIRFCGEQANRDGFQYFWIDTCCINKANKAELSLAIRSMFRWYRDAVRCYAYLSDVSVSQPQVDKDSRLPAWEADFRRSEWFTRGWTLQELLAPSSVEFFSREWEKLGDKRLLLIHLIHEITGIPYSALRGARLSQFSINERLRWNEYRHTTRPEDKVYSILGVVEIDLAPCYGEGQVGAFKRLHDETDKTQRCIQDLRDTDPRDDKKRIEDTKGGLLKDSYSWVFYNDSFRQWREDQYGSQLLWIKSDPGKGKTMLLCGIIDELHNSIPQSALLSYFFCQATDARINSATGVLRGLLYMLVSQQPSLASHVRKKYDYADKTIFEDTNAWVAIAKIFTDVLQDPSLTTTYLIVDAIDECITNLPELLDFVVKHSSVCSRVKWIVSSRNWPEIEERLEQTGHIRLSLELNTTSVSTAVQIFIDQRVSELAQQNKYDEPTKRAVLEHLASNANDTFLWVALVCQHLRATAKRNVLRKLKLFPPGLDALYERMMQQINKTDDAELCKQVLATVALVYRPITLKELVSLVEPLEDIVDESELQDIIRYCGSFLVLRGQTVYFVHQSAQDFLLTRAAPEVFLAGRGAFHYAILTRSLQVMSRTLQRDIYSLKTLDVSINNVKIPEPDPLTALRYSCVHWVDHMRDSNPTASTVHAECLRDGGIVDGFLRAKFLYWLESLSLCKSMSKGVVSINEVQMLVQGQGEATSFTRLVYDIYRFVRYHKQAIESSPLQVYGSGLLFSPKQSIVRKLFQHEEPKGIAFKTGISDRWSACLQTLEGHRSGVESVAFSHDSTLLASGSGDHTIKIWDASSGTCLQTLEGHRSDVGSVAFSHDSTLLASGAGDNTVNIWNVGSGTCLKTLEGHSFTVVLVVFSQDSNRLASSDKISAKIWDVGSGTCLQTVEDNSITMDFSHDLKQVTSYDAKAFKIWDVGSGTCLQTIEHHSEFVRMMAFSHDSKQLASSDQKVVKIWNISSGECLLQLDYDSDTVQLVAFSHDSTRLALATCHDTIHIWDIKKAVCLQELRGHSDYIRSITFSHNSARLVSASWDMTVRIWDTISGVCLQTLEGHSDLVDSMAFPLDLTQLVSESTDATVKMSSTSSSAGLQTSKSHSDYVCWVTFSHDLAQLASASWDKTIKIWDVGNGECLHTLRSHSRLVLSAAFSHKSTWLASASLDTTVKMWDTRSGACLQTLDGHSLSVDSVAFSHDSTRLASASGGSAITIWDTDTGVCLQTLENCSSTVRSVCFSHDSTRLVSTFRNTAIGIWDTASGACIKTLWGHTGSVTSAAFSNDGTRIVSSSADYTIKIWDTSSGVCMRTLHVGRSLRTLSFDATGEYLLTDMGSIHVSRSMGLDAENATVLRHPLYVGVGVSIDSMWITYDGKKLVWIPPEYRPSCSSVRGDTIGIGAGSGSILICRVNLQMGF